MDILSIPNTVALTFFFLLILALGIWAGKKNRRKYSVEEFITADRRLNLHICVISLLAVSIGGKFVSDASETVYSRGLVWTHIFLGDSIFQACAGLLLARKMHDQGCVTILDPVHRKYGRVMSGLLFVLVFLEDLLRIASTLQSLSSSLSMILQLNMKYTIFLSGAVALAYTLHGGMHAVAYTGVLQFCCIVFTLIISVPFAMSNSWVQPILTTAKVRLVNGSQVVGWLGRLEPINSIHYVDELLSSIFSVMSCQVFFQRILATRKARDAKLASLTAPLIASVLLVPPVMLGAIGASVADSFNETRTPSMDTHVPLKTQTLPWLLIHLCPPGISFLSIGLLGGAAMCVVDSSLLSSGSVFARNIMQQIFVSKVTARQTMWSTRTLLVIFNATACILALTVSNIRAWLRLFVDLNYAVLLPQLMSSVCLGWSNTYGSFAGLVAGLFVQLSAGLPDINLAPLIKLSGKVKEQAAAYGIFPANTISILCSLAACTLVSYAAHHIFKSALLPPAWDVLGCVVRPEAPSAAEGDAAKVEMMLAVHSDRQRQLMAVHTGRTTNEASTSHGFHSAPGQAQHQAVRKYSTTFEND